MDTSRRPRPRKPRSRAAVGNTRAIICVSILRDAVARFPCTPFTTHGRRVLLMGREAFRIYIAGKFSRFACDCIAPRTTAVAQTALRNQLGMKNTS
jgi:hypothetical protein